MTLQPGTGDERCRPIRWHAFSSALFVSRAEQLYSPPHLHIPMAPLAALLHGNMNSSAAVVYIAELSSFESATAANCKRWWLHLQGVRPAGWEKSGYSAGCGRLIAQKGNITHTRQPFFAKTCHTNMMMHRWWRGRKSMTWCVMRVFGVPLAEKLDLWSFSCGTYEAKQIMIIYIIILSKIVGFAVYYYVRLLV